MNLFAVIFRGEAPARALEVANTVSRNEAFEISEGVFLVHSQIDSPEILGDMFGMSDDSGSPQIGVVFKLNGSYSGYYHNDLWEWLAEARERTSA